MYSCARSGQHRRRERPPPFAKLYGVVHAFGHLRISRVGEDRSVSQRARSEFHSPLHPSDDFSCGQQLSSNASWARHATRTNFISCERLFDLRVCALWAERRMAHFCHRQRAAAIEIRGQHCAQARAIVTSCGLHKNAIDCAARKKFSVRLRIQRHATCEAQISRAGSPHGVARQAEHRSLARILHCPRDVLVVRLDFRFGRARRAESLHKLRNRAGAIAKKPPRRHAVRHFVRGDEITQIDPRFAIRGEAHHFPLIAEWRESQVMRELCVEKSQRIGEGNCVQVLECSAASVPQRRRFVRAAAIHHQHRRIIESGVRIRADRMRKMVIDESEFRASLAEFAYERFSSALLQSAAGVIPHRGENSCGRNRKRAGEHALHIVPRESARLRPAVADQVEVARAHSRKIEARANREHRKTRIVFHAAQPLFRYSEENLAVARDTSGRIMRVREIIDAESDQSLAGEPGTLKSSTCSSLSPKASVECASAISLRRARFSLRVGSASAASTALANSAAVSPK